MVGQEVIGAWALLQEAMLAWAAVEACAGKEALVARVACSVEVACVAEVVWWATQSPMPMGIQTVMGE